MKPERVNFENVSISPEQQEELARRFPPCERTDVSTDGWQVHVEGPVRLTIPPELAVAERMGSHIVVWHAPDETLLLLTLHDGNGRANMTIALDDGVAEPRTEPICRIRCAGRDALIHLSSHVSGERRVFTGKIDVGVRAGLGFGLAFLAPDPARSAEFVRIVELASVETGADQPPSLD